MTRHHMTSDGPVPFTQEEETARDAEELAWEEIKPFRKWQESMQETDSSMPRFLEDLISSNASLVVPAEMKKRYDAKIKIRGEKP